MKYVYADYNATAPCPHGHYKQVLSILERVYANPSSIHHLGREAKLILEESRQKIALLFGADKNCIFFSSGATESNNIVIQGLVHERFYKTAKKVKVLISNSEHASVYQTAEALHKRGLCELIYLPVTPQGVLDVEASLDSITSDLDLVSLIHVNNETGAINPIAELAERIRKKAPSAHIHIDAVQSLGKLDLRWIAASPIDSASASAHKVGSFKGIGCLYKKRGLGIVPLIYGGGQERGWRGGTENLPGIISFGLRAGELEPEAWSNQFEPLRTRFVEGLREIPEAHLHSDPSVCIPTTVNFHVDGLRGEELLLSFDAAGIYVSGGSACSSGGGRPSHVLKAMGYPDELAAHSIRVSFGEGTRIEDLEYILKTLQDLVRWKKRGSSK